MYVYRIAIAVLTFLNTRLSKAAMAEFDAFDRTMEDIDKLHIKATEHVSNAKKADALATKIKGLVD